MRSVQFNNPLPNPPHGVYIAGYVEISYQDRDQENDCGKSKTPAPENLLEICNQIIHMSADPCANCITGEITRVNRYWTRRYLAWSYDLVTDNLFIGGSCELADHPRDDWAPFGVGRTTYKYLGRIKPGLTEEGIELEAKALLANMGTYNLINNNCFTFINKIYNAEQAF